MSSIGEQIRQAREGKRLSLEQAAQATRIRLRYLQAIEADDFNALPSMAQVRGFIRAYAQWLDISPTSLLAQLDGHPAPPDTGGFTAGAGAQGQHAENPLPSSSQTDRSSPQLIFEEIGTRLRRQRELLGLSLDDVERNIHIRLHYLQVLENGKYDQLPSPVQGRGMLSNYAHFLGMEIEPLLLRYADGLQARLSLRQAAARLSASTDRPSARKDRARPWARPRAKIPGPLQRFFSRDLLAGGCLVIFLLAFVIWTALRISQMQANQQPTLTAPSVAEVLAPDTPTPELPESLTATAAARPIDQTAEPDSLAENPSPQPVLDVTSTSEPSSTFQAVESGKIQLYLLARQRAWVRVIVDGKVELEGRVVPGSAYPFAGETRIEVLTGNGAALQVFLNRQDLGPLGIFGEVVQRVFTLQGMQTPTPAVPPTATPSPTSTITPQASGTPAASASETPTNTAP